VSAGVKRSSDLSEATLTLRPLGEFIEECDERNEKGEFAIADVRGISINKSVISTKADMTGVSLSSYKQFKHNEFCVVTVTSRNGGKISLARNEDENTYIVSSSYVVFRIRSVELMPEFLSMVFGRSEFDRYARFNSWGSAREVFSYEDMSRVEIPVPSLAVQQKVVDVWRGLRKMKEENEALAAPLMQLCRSYLQDCKKKWPMKELGNYIAERNERNTDCVFTAIDLQGVACTQRFIKSIATTNGMYLGNHKIVRKGDFAYSNRINVGSIAYRSDGDCIVSPSYTVFHVVDDKVLMPEFLSILYMRPEFLRATLFFAFGTIKDDFSYKNMARYKIPLPPIEVQQAVVDVYRCASEAKKIAEEADRLSREICPALVRWAAEGGTA
jgi:type I restriction enzyme S subunit